MSLCFLTVEHVSALCCESKPVRVYTLNNRYFMCRFHVFEIFEVKLLWSRFSTVQGQPRSEVMVPIDSAWVVSSFLPLTPLSYLSPFSKNFNVKFYWTWTTRVQVYHSAYRKPMVGFLSDVLLSPTYIYIIYFTIFEVFDANSVLQ